MVREVPDTEAILYGDGDDKGAVESILATEAKGLPVRMGGRVNSDRIQDQLLQCDVIVLLSDYEGLPIALMEAMACGCVPVCLRIRSGIPELVEDGVTGLLVNDRGDSFVAAIRRLREEPSLWERLSRAARATIEAEYSSEFCAGQWADLLRSLHANSGPKRPIKIPRRIKLPPTHPGFAHQDPRPSPPPLYVRFYRRARMAAGSGGAACWDSRFRKLKKMGAICIINGYTNAVSETFIHAHIEYLEGKKVVLNSYYPEYTYNGRRIRFFYGKHPFFRSFKKLLPQFLYHEVAVCSFSVGELRPGRSADKWMQKQPA